MKVLEACWSLLAHLADQPPQNEDVQSHGFSDAGALHFDCHLSPAVP